MKTKNYTKVRSLDEAYELLQKSRRSRIIGGGTFLKMTRMHVSNLIDLKDLGLDYIREDSAELHIGAYTTLREIETSETVRKVCGSCLSDVLGHLIGVQLRNVITIGGHVAPRLGFSDIIPTLTALHASVEFYHRGRVLLEDFLTEDINARTKRDILTEIVIPKENRHVKVQMMRKSYLDYSIFCLAVSRAGHIGVNPPAQNPGPEWIVCGGNFPGRARLAGPAMKEMNAISVKPDDAERLAEKITECYSFGSNYRGSGEYRRQLCRVFAERAIRELCNEGDSDTQS